MASHAKGRWKSCKVGRPCLICGAKHWCAYSADEVWSKCRHDTSQPGAIVREDSLGEYALYAHDGGAGASPEAQSRRKTYEPPPRPDPVLCNEVNSALLQMLRLEHHHEASLKLRGLSDEQIDAAMFRTMLPPPRTAECIRLREQFGDRLLEVPGFWKDKANRVHLIADAGIVIPVRDLEGRIVALKIRRDNVDDDGPKYRIVSSSPKDGPSPGSPVHVPFWTGSFERIRVTEGELKSEVLSALSKTLTISIPGAMSLSNVMDVLKTIGPKTVVAAWDADKSARKVDEDDPTKIKINWVARGFERGSLMIADAGYELEVEHWDPQYGKGLDDVYQKGNADKVATLTGQDAWKCVVETVKATWQEPDARSYERAGMEPPPSPPPENEPGKGEAKKGRAGRAANDNNGAPPAQGDGNGGGGGEQPGDAFVLGDAPELAHQLLKDLQGNSGIVPVCDRGDLWSYDQLTGLWVCNGDDRCHQIVSGYSGRPVVNGDDEDDDGKPLKLSHQQIEGAVKTARKLAAQPGVFLETDIGMVGFKNGVVKLIDGKAVLLPHSPDHRITFVLPFDYDPLAKCPLWERTLIEIFGQGKTLEEITKDLVLLEELSRRINMLQEFYGGGIMGLATKYAKCLIALGRGRNGKSTILDTLERLLPEHVKSSLPPQLWSNRFMLSTLAGKRLNTVGELPERDMMESEIFKAVITGDPTQADVKYRASFRLRPIAAHVFAANGLPAFADQSVGFIERFLILPFDRYFSETERDPDLKEKLAEELQGIATWVIQGAERLVQNKGRYKLPQTGVEALKTWRQDNDQVMVFVEECLEKIETAEAISLRGVRPTELYGAYVGWAKRNGHNALNSRKFKHRVERMIGEQIRVGHSGERIYAWELVRGSGRRGPSTGSGGGEPGGVFNEDEGTSESAPPSYEDEVDPNDVDPNRKVH